MLGLRFCQDIVSLHGKPFRSRYFIFLRDKTRPVAPEKAGLRRAARVLALVAAALLSWPAWISPTRAQGASAGAIAGTVTAKPKGAVPGARVSIEEPATGLARTATTNGNGLFAVQDLPAGTYRMTVSMAGYATQVWSQIVVTAGAGRVLNVVMRPGDPRRVIRVTAPPALVSEPCPTVCGTASSSTASNVPLNGRDWAALATLQAGVTGVQTGSATGAGNTDIGFGAPISVSGARPDQNDYRLDGISISDYANGAPGSVLGDNLGIDAVQQVSVLGSNYPAEYGRTSGGVINVVTRSGTNSFHGSVYEFLRNSALDARNFFDGSRIPPFKRNQFGASAGLPIQKNLTFLFGDYEGLRQSLGVTTVNTVPSANARLGIVHDASGNLLGPGGSPVSAPWSGPCPNPSTQTNLAPGQAGFCVDNFIAAGTPQHPPFLGAFFPSTNGPLIGNGDTGIFSFAAQEITTENYFTLRLDHKFTGADSIHATYMRDYSTTVEPGTFGELSFDVVSNRQAATLHEEHIFSANLLNSARIGFNRAVGISGKVDRILNPLLSDSYYAFVPGGFAGNIQSIPGITSFSGAPTADGYLPSSDAFYWNSYQAGDDAVLTRGMHSIKFGGEVEFMQDNMDQSGNINGAFRFDSLTQFLTNSPSFFSSAGLSSPSRTGTRETRFAAYAQDDIRALKTLTVNGGLRYEMVTVPTEAHGLTAVLRNLTDPLPVCGIAAPGCAGVGPLFSNPTLRNFEPRLGFAWNPGGGKNIVRGGFGIFDVLPLPYEFTLSFQHAAPFYRTVVGSNPTQGSLPMGAYQEFINQSNTNLAYYAQPHPKRNYVLQWNLSVARELSSTLALTIGYVGSRGIHQPYRVDNIDMVLPTLTPAGYLWPKPNTAPLATPTTCPDGSAPTPTGCPWPRLNPNFGRINATLWQASSFYDALQVDLLKRVGHGVQFHAAYTWGKSIDTLSATVANDAYPNGLFNQLFFDQRTTRGLSDFNVAQTLVLTGTWEIPSPRKTSILPEWALGGWQLVALYKASTGQPFTPILGGDPQGTRLDETGEVPSIIPGCNPVNANYRKNPGGPFYLNRSCFILPQATAAIAAQCQPFGFQPASSSGSGNSGIPGTCANLRGNLGRNAIIGPGLSKLDFSVFKNNYIKRISETFNVQFRVEIFNIFNRTNYASPTSRLTMFDQNGQPIQSAGLVDSTQTTSRQIQFAIKFLW
ncbi:MAG TPA: carboxypeptidase regulatory-like domain-containing protein [Candidatus Dormibacteraeota bacterium]|nr:carboxypeptidase regulatory-like domain-containing protein [Candidatus Dormibacteraeota bacterium]